MIQADIVKKAIARFPNLPVRTIARYILMQSGEYFDGDYEKIRSSVRWYLGKAGKRSKAYERTTPPTMPLTWRMKRTPYHLSPGLWLLLFDVHVPFHEPKAVEAAIKYGQDQKVTGILFPGDLQDCAIVDIGKDWVRVREEYSRATVYLRKSEIKLAEESDQELTSLINSIQGGGLG